MGTLSARSRVLSSALAAVSLTLGAGTAARGEENLNAAVRAALTAAVPISGARVEVGTFDRPLSNCLTTSSDTHIETSRPIDGSGRVAVKLTGSRPGGAACDVWAWAVVRVFAKVPVTRRAVRAGEVLAPAVQLEEREVKSGHSPAIWETIVADGTVAQRSLGTGQLIEADAVRVAGLRTGETVKILIVSGALAIEQNGRAVPCARGRTCAVLPSGKHIEGTLVDGRVMVQMP